MRGRRLRHRHRRDRRRRPERNRGRRHDRHVRAAAAAQRRRRPAGDQEGRDGAGRPGRSSTRPTSTKDAATRAQAQITSALRLFGHHGNPGARAGDARRACGARHARGRDALLAAAGDQQGRSALARRLGPRVLQITAFDASGHRRSAFRRCRRANGRLAQAAREKQALAWMWERIDAGLKQAFRQHPQVRELLPAHHRRRWRPARCPHRPRRAILLRGRTGAATTIHLETLHDGTP